MLFHLSWTAMKIQCSDATYTLLKKLGRFRLECRGNISVKVISIWVCSLQLTYTPPEHGAILGSCI